MAKAKDQPQIIADPIIGTMPSGPMILPSLYLPDGNLNPSSIAYYRAAHDLDQATFGAIIGATQQQVSMWERGRVKPNAKAHARIYQFVQATALLLQKYNGFIPANLQAGAIFQGEEGKDALQTLLDAVDQTAEQAAEIAQKQARQKEDALELLGTVAEQLQTTYRLVENTMRKIRREW